MTNTKKWTRMTSLALLGMLMTAGTIVAAPSAEATEVSVCNSTICAKVFTDAGSCYVHASPPYVVHCKW